MRSRYLYFVVAAAVMLLGLALAVMVLLPRTHIEVSNPPLRIAIVIVTAFLVITLIRYFILLWLGYLHHVEAKTSLDDGERFEPLVTILVPAYNEEAVIEASIRSLLELDYPAYDILVIDDGSTDETYQRAAELEGYYGRATVRVVSKSNGGKASALNTGIALARTPFVLCMDGDSRLSPGTLRHAMPHFRDSRVGAVAGNVKVVNRRNLWTCLQALEYIEGLNMARRAQGFVRAVNIVPGPIGIFRRDTLASVGGYDSDTYAEDADLTLKLLTDGWHVVYEDQAIAYTEAPEHLLDLLKQRYRWSRGILQALRKHSASLLSPRTRFATWVSLQSMLFEAIAWPLMNVCGNLFFSIAALMAGSPVYVLYWWLLLTWLDVAAALHTVAMEEEDLRLVPLSVLYRFFFIATVDVVKLFATVEELLKFKMGWGKLERAGRI
jgi:cellulose synthase/poly-beta-1,6-N-acetylglucosamine synthase-like glycosyltransferase